MEQEKRQKLLQECSCDKLVKSMLFQQNDINPLIYGRFAVNLDLEQLGEDFLVCGTSSDLECLAEEFKTHFLVKKAEIVSMRHEHQKETHFLERRICVDDFAWHVELDQRYVESLLDAQVMNHCNLMATPGSKEKERHAASDKLDPKEHQEFLSGAGICQYMTEQRFDIAFSTKELVRDAAGPTASSMMKKRITRYLKGSQRGVLNLDADWLETQRRGAPRLEVAKLEDIIHVTVTADWAGDPQGAPRLEKYWLLVRASLFVSGQWAKHLAVQTLWVRQLAKIGLISLNTLDTLENVAED